MSFVIVISYFYNFSFSIRFFFSLFLILLFFFIFSPSIIPVRFCRFFLRRPLYFTKSITFSINKNNFIFCNVIHRTLNIVILHLHLLL
ncbi:MAG TPA: hypothetical protein DCR12_02380 [Lachnospiraceae bacterium]|nr:hypothetical protein [Lachnospiraceae bacterium]